MHLSRPLAGFAVALVLLASPSIALAGPVGPSKVTVVDSGGTATVSWQMIKDPTVFYRVVRGVDQKDPGQDLTKPLSVEFTSFVDTTVAAGTTYFYTVIAMYPDGTQIASVPAPYTVPVPAPPPVVITAPAGLPTGTLQAPIAAPISEAPSGVTVTGTPLMAYVAWNPVAGALNYAVFRSDDGSRPALRNPKPLTVTQFSEQLPDPRPAYSYTIVVHYPDRTSAVSLPVAYTSPPLLNPTSFSATPEIGGPVTLRWNAPPGVTFYRIVGPGLQNLVWQGVPFTEQELAAVSVRDVPATDTKATVNLARYLVGGTYRYSITANYRGSTGSFADSASAARTSVTLRGSIPHFPWLILKDPFYGQDDNGTPLSHEKAGDYQWKTEARSNATYLTDVAWLAENGFNDPTGVVRAVYYNAGDLGFGRDMRCKQIGEIVRCFVSNHGPDPIGIGMNSGYPDSERALADAISGSEIIGSVAMEVSLARPDEIKFYSFLPHKAGCCNGQAHVHAMFDDEPDIHGHGSEIESPFNCMSCHGGRYDDVSKAVKGASFLPFDVFSFEYSRQPGYTLGDQEEAFRKLNALVKLTRPNATQPDNPIVSLIDGMYRGGVDVPGTRASNAWVPKGWAAAPNVYNVFKKFCRTCHLAMSGDLTFSSYYKVRTPAVDPNTGQSLHGIREQVEAVICGHTMPHAEVPFRKFWQDPRVSWAAFLQDPAVLGIKCTAP